MPTDTSIRIAYIADVNSIHTRRWINWFAGRGHDVCLLSPTARNSTVDLVPLNSRIRVYELATPLSRFLPGNVGLPLRLLLDLREVRRIVALEDPEIVHGHFVHYNGWLAAMCGHSAVVLSGWGSDIHTAPKKFRGYRAMTQFALRHAIVATAASADLAEMMIRLGARREATYTIAHGIDVQVMKRRSVKEIQSLRRELCIDDGPVVFSPRLMRPIYNTDIIARAVTEVHKSRSDVTTIFCSTGATREYERLIRTQLVELERAGRVRLVGDIKYEDMALYYSLADATISIPRTDGGGLSVLEAMAAGSIPIVSNIPAYDKLMAGNYAVVASELTAKAVSAAILRALEIRGDLDSTRARNEEFAMRADYRNSMTEMEGVYAATAEGERRRRGEKRERKHAQ